MKTRLLTIVLLSFCSLAAFSQSKKFAKDIKEVLYIHDTASSVTSEVVALNAFKDLAGKYPEEWLPPYWTAYLCTQIARLEGRSDDYPKDMNAKQLLEDSKKYLDQSVRIKGDMNDLERSNFLMLEGFIYSFFSFMVATTDEDREKYTNLREEKYKAAIKLNPRNPLMYVSRAIVLTRAEDYGDVMAGIGLLDYAEQIYSKADNRGLTTYWNKDFIKFWRARAEKRLPELL